MSGEREEAAAVSALEAIHDWAVDALNTSSLMASKLGDNNLAEYWQGRCSALNDVCQAVRRTNPASFRSEGARR